MKRISVLHETTACRSHHRSKQVGYTITRTLEGSSFGMNGCCLSSTTSHVTISDHFNSESRWNTVVGTFARIWCGLQVANGLGPPKVSTRMQPWHQTYLPKRNIDCPQTIHWWIWVVGQQPIHRPATIRIYNHSTMGQMFNFPISLVAPSKYALGRPNTRALV